MSLGRPRYFVTFVLVSVLLGLAGGSAAQAAQSPQTVTVQPDMVHWEHVPDELPGTYQGLIVVRTTVSGGGCLCAPGTTTTVALAIDAEEPITQAVVSPSSYAVDWWADPQTQQHGHEKIVQVTLHMDETDADLVTFDLETAADTSSPLQETRALSSAYAVPMPQEAPDDTSEEGASGDEDDANSSEGREASTQSVTEPDQLQQAAVPGAGVVAALIALGVVAWRRGRA